MKIRPATSGDAPALGRIMVASWLSAHRGHMPEAAWQKREAEWTPDVSARGWARTLLAQAKGNAPREVLLVAEDDAAEVTALAYAIPVEDVSSGSCATLSALYVSPAHRRKGIGSALLQDVARELADLGFAALRVEVLTANLPARSFYETMGALEIDTGTFDEEGYLLHVTVYEWPDITALVGVISRRSAAAWAALLGGALWLAQGVVLIARGGTEPDPRIEAVTFSCGFMALVAAAGLASWVSSAAKSTPVRTALAGLAALSVPVAVFLGQVAAFALPGSHWLESDAIVLVIALVAIFCGTKWLTRRSHVG